MIAIKEYLLDKAKAIKHCSSLKATDDTIRSIVNEELDNLGMEADLNHIDTSHVTNMYELFRGREDFNGDISKWDVSKVTSMERMFQGCKHFNGDLSKWDVSRLEKAYCMFFCCYEFEGHGLAKWNTSSLRDAGHMLSGCKAFNEPIGSWDISNVHDFHDMLLDTINLKQDLSSWKITFMNPYHNVKNMIKGSKLMKYKKLRPEFI